MVAVPGLNHRHAEKLFTSVLSCFKFGEREHIPSSARSHVGVGFGALEPLNPCTKVPWKNCKSARRRLNGLHLTALGSGF